MNVTQCSAPTLSLSVNNNNRITNSGISYDASGDGTGCSGVRSLPRMAGNADSYFGTNRRSPPLRGKLRPPLQWRTQALMASANGVNYTYDGDRKRVEKSNGTLYWYDPSGNVLEESDLSGNLLHDYIYFGGKRIARQDGFTGSSLYYYFQDHLGTALMMVDAWGHVQQQSVYYPFGGERVITNNVANNYKFTGLERDSESGLDHTVFRQYTSNLGRWSSPDRVPGIVSNPQSWNRYSYVLNDPTTLTDRLGLQSPRVYAPGIDPCELDLFMCGGGGGGGGCQLNGMDMPCDTVASAIGADAAVQCPNNECNGVQALQGPNGTTVIQQQQWVPASTTVTNTQSCVAVLGVSSCGDVQTTVSQSTGYWQTAGAVENTSLGFSGIASSAWNFITGLTYAGSINIPVPEDLSPGGVNISLAYTPSTHSGCVGLGAWVGTPGGKTVSGGPIVLGNLGNIHAIFNGFSWSGGVVFPGGVGYQSIWNSKGSVGGPIFGLNPGASLAYSYSGCIGGN